MSPLTPTPSDRMGGKLRKAITPRRHPCRSPRYLVAFVRASAMLAVTKSIVPLTLRNAFITAALDAGLPLQDVQEAASHADPRTTMRYDRARVSLDRHATYIVSTIITGASR